MNGWHLLLFAVAFAVVFVNFLIEQANRERRVTIDLLAPPAASSLDATQDRHHAYAEDEQP